MRQRPFTRLILCLKPLPVTVTLTQMGALTKMVPNLMTAIQVDNRYTTVQTSIVPPIQSSHIETSDHSHDEAPSSAMA